MRAIYVLMGLALSSCTGLPGDALTRESLIGPPKPPSREAQAYAHYITAALYTRLNRDEEALEQIQRTVDLDPKALSPMISLIHGHLLNHDFQSALAAAEQAAERFPDRASLHIALGELYHHFERYDEAVAAFERAIELDPENAAGYGALLEIQEQTNDLVAAIDIYRRLLEMRPDSAQLHIQLGLNLAIIEDYEAARATLERALELDPSKPQPRLVLGMVYLELGENEQAAAQFEKVLEADAENKRAREHLAVALARLGRPAGALEQLDTLTQTHGGDARHTLERILLLIRAERFEQAADVAPPEGLPVLGALFHALARQRAALPFRPIIESLDTLEGDIDVECDLALGDVLFFFGQKSAGQELLDAVETWQNDGLASRTLGLFAGRILIFIEEYSQAEQALVDVLEHFGPSKNLHYYLAVVYDELGMFEAMETHLLACLELDPDDPEVMNYLGYMYAVEGVKLDKAEELLNDALALDPENGFYLDSLGWIHYRKGDAEQAIEYIKRALKNMDQDDAEVRDHLGDAYLLEGDVERAVAEWERSLRLDPKRDGVAEKIEAHKQRAPSS